MHMSSFTLCPFATSVTIFTNYLRFVPSWHFEVFNERFPKQSCAETRPKGISAQIPFEDSKCRRRPSVQPSLFEEYTFMIIYAICIVITRGDLPPRYADDMVKSKLDPFWFICVRKSMRETRCTTSIQLWRWKNTKYIILILDPNHFFCVFNSTCSP
jgi:hypothetical protein